MPKPKVGTCRCGHRKAAHNFALAADLAHWRREVSGVCMKKGCECKSYQHR